MEKGFFIVLTQKKRPDAQGKKIISWRAEPVEETQGWLPVMADTPEEAIKLEKEQYRRRQALREAVPQLVGANDGPMASGKMTRFVGVK